MGTIDELTAHLDLLTRKAATLPRDVAEVVAPILALNVRTVMGDNMKLQDLAESTQIERLGLGYTANDPLVRSGELRDSVMPEVVGVFGSEFAAAGSEDPRSGWLEFGTATIPARPSFEIGLMETEMVAKGVSLNASVKLLRDS
jgi:hypothetical protein